MNKKIFWSAVLILSICVSTICGASENNSAYQQITQEEAMQIMEEENDYVILDVRRPDEYDSGHIPGAICIPNEEIDDVPPEELPDLDQLILVYCRSGRRSKEAAEKLAAMGYTDVREFGGIITWEGEIVSSEAEEAVSTADLSDASVDNDGAAPSSRESDTGSLRIVKDAQYTYEFDENGLCIAGTGLDGSGFTSTYDTNADGLPVNRYINTGNGDELYETYEYAADGSLSSLTVNPGKEEQVVFQYDEGGRLTYADNYFLFPGMGFRNAAFSWDHDGRLIKVVSSYAVTEEELVSWVARAGAGEEVTEENRAAALKRLQDFFENKQPEKTDDGKILLEEQTQTYTYDTEGRVTEYQDTMRDTAVYAWLQKGREIDSYERTDGLSFDYWEQLVSIKASMQAFLDGADNGFNEYGPFEFGIQYGANGLPIMMEGINTDIYDKLNCQAVSADIGFYGYWWNDTMLDFMGESHGGIAGLPFDKSSVQTGTVLALRVQGKTETGQDAVYYCMPDMLGRQMCEKFVDGRLTMPCSLEMDPERRNQIVITTDEDIVHYEDSNSGR